MPLSVPPSFTGQFQRVGIGLPNKLRTAAGEEYAAAEVVEGVDTVTGAFEDLDVVVESLAGVVVFFIFPSVLVSRQHAEKAPVTLFL